MKDKSMIKSKLYQNNLDWNRMMNELATCAPYRINVVLAEIDRINRERYELILEEKGEKDNAH